jgi:hypothetical protein
METKKETPEDFLSNYYPELYCEGPSGYSDSGYTYNQVIEIMEAYYQERIKQKTSKKIIKKQRGKQLSIETKLSIIEELKKGSNAIGLSIKYNTSIDSIYKIKERHTDLCKKYKKRLVSNKNSNNKSSC